MIKDGNMRQKKKWINQGCMNVIEIPELIVSPLQGTTDINNCIYLRVSLISGHVAYTLCDKRWEYEAKKKMNG